MKSPFREPPLVAKRYSPPKGVTYTKRRSKQISDTLTCVQKLRPESDLHVLTKDCISLIGTAGSSYLQRFDDVEPVELHFCVEISTLFDFQAHLLGFDSSYTNFRTEEGSYDGWKITFLCWPHEKTFTDDYASMAEHVMQLIKDADAQLAADPTYIRGVDINDTEDLGAFQLHDDNVCDAVFVQLFDGDDEETDSPPNSVTITYYINKPRFS